MRHMIMASVEKQSRILIWAAPRSLSTGFLRAMFNRTRTKVFLEPFANAYYFGPERVSERYKSEDDMENSRYEDIKHQLEQSYEGVSTIVSKDMAYALGHNKEKMRRYLPAGYVHTFLIRHPTKSLSSLYKMSTSPELTGWDHFNPKEAGFKELHYLFEIVTEELGQEAVVIDTDDLLEQPEAMLRLYCDKVGLAYEDSMLHWSAETEDLSVLDNWPVGWFSTLLKTTTFQRRQSYRMPDLSSLPDIVKQAVKDSMPHYNSLYEQRLTIN